MKHLYNYKRPLDKKRLFLSLAMFEEGTTPLPAKVDLRALCPPVFNQGQVGSCHDDKTEVLTASGWKLFSDITINEKLASVNPETKELIYEYPTRLVRFSYTGPMHYVDKTNMNFAITPDHKMVVRKWDEGARTLTESYSFVDIKDIGWYAGLPCGAEQKGEEVEFYILPGVENKTSPSQRVDRKIPMSTWMKFLGIYMAEGTVLQEEGAYKIQLAASKEREKFFIREVMEELEISALELEDRFTFCNKQLFKEMEKLNLKGVRAPNKFVPEFVFKMTTKNIKSFLLGHAAGDGCYQGEFVSHYTSSKRLADDLQRLIILSGGWGIISSRDPRSSAMKDGRVINGNYPVYRVSEWTDLKLSIERKGDVSIGEYSGEVFCAEVPTFHTLVTRREGKVLISGNCTANALAGAWGFLEKKALIAKAIASPETFNPTSYSPASRLFIYYNERTIEGDVDTDGGAMIADGVSALLHVGCCDETVWPYDEGAFAQRPSPAAYAEAAQHKIGSTAQLSGLQHMKQCLANGLPFVFGFQVYENFESSETAATGMMGMPTGDCLGGHAVMTCGYDDSIQCMIVRNSWGESWAQGGYFFMPYAYINDQSLCSEFFVLSK